MKMRTATTVDSRGAMTIPAELRRRYGLEEGTRVVIESRRDGILLRPVSSIARHTYSDQRRAEFLLTNATDEEDYRRALETVRAMGLDPGDVPHERRLAVC